MGTDTRLSQGVLFKMENGKLVKVCDVIDSEDIEFTTSDDDTYYTVEPPKERAILTKKQAKKLLKYEKNPMARKQLQRIISAKEL